ncbi:hypothetical protein [Microbacterium sp. p3-SID131]|uniref:hypothetical protein n=1 Tax=Microbacterium sp. p3-SID131 TaxID=2916215 RepID=UPI0021A83D0A|nr:hypothetical protein [Microbacterium sp. p3-SID131]MCT1363324.1 hypothetical protein [Microbacterium sp. p3-SID131]
MSDETRAKLDEAINAHVAENFPGYYTTAWVVIAASTALDRPDSTNYRLFSPNSQPFHVDNGLITVGAKILEDSWDDADDDLDDEDE